MLVVEDDDDLRDALTAVVRVHGHAVLAAADAGEALSMLVASAPAPAVVVLDLLMPQVSGRDFLKAMRLLDRARHVPVVVLTGLELSEADRSALGVEEVLQKPVGVDRLLHAIRRACARVPTCRVCSLPMTVANDHRIPALEASRTFGMMRCRMCGKGARVRCVVEAGTFWIECSEGHRTRARA